MAKCTVVLSKKLINNLLTFEPKEAQKLFEQSENRVELLVSTFEVKKTIALAFSRFYWYLVIR